uniref:Uncharacterized protein n=1 Tax=Nelumbo nucifera TaxID=4432 RepID=A0A822ZLK8_NELNU|nr:TPA_asm: hypothetical protein HUJ06_002575 [Nelumbo nucifera]
MGILTSFISSTGLPAFPICLPSMFRASGVKVQAYCKGNQGNFADLDAQSIQSVCLFLKLLTF